MSKVNVKKLTLAAVLIAIGVVCSTFAIPVGFAKCFPIQHLVNVLSAMLLGPWYALGNAFVISLLRNLMGTGTLLAFPGSMVGAFLAGIMFMKFRKVWSAFIGEIVGTGIIGAILCYPIALLIMHNTSAALFGYVIPFGVSSLGGAILAVLIYLALDRTGVLAHFNGGMAYEKTSNHRRLG
jgi:energy coupling factor transporter S component ThiW